jgi:hypothetical protein
MTRKQLKDIVATLIGAIPDDLSFEEAQAAIGGKGQLVKSVAAAFDPYRVKRSESGATGTYPVSVPYNGASTIKELVANGRYDWSNDNITDRNFPQEKTGAEDVEIELVHLDRNISTDDALAELDKRGLRPANPAELLAFGATFPEVQREFPVIALGQYWRGPLGNRGVVCLDGSGGKRDADLHWFGLDWLRGCRFAGVRK